MDEEQLFQYGDVIDLAVAEIDEGNFRRAIARLKKAISENIMPPLDKAELLLTLASAYETRDGDGDLTLAIKALAQALPLSAADPNIEAEIRLLYSKCRMARDENNDCEKAIAILEKAVLLEISDPDLKIHVHWALSKALFADEGYDMDAVLEAYEELLDLPFFHSLPSLKMEVLLDFAHVLLRDWIGDRDSDVGKALARIDEASQIEGIGEDRKAKCLYQKALALDEIRQADPASAISFATIFETFEQAAALAEDADLKNVILLGMAACMAAAKQPSAQVIEAYERVSLADLPDDAAKASVQSSLGEQLLHRNLPAAGQLSSDLDRAIDCFKQAAALMPLPPSGLHVDVEDDLQEEREKYFTNLGFAYQKRNLGGDLDLAIQAFRKALDSSLASDNEIDGYAELNLVKALAARNGIQDLDIAITLLLEALKLGVKLAADHEIRLALADYLVQRNRQGTWNQKGDLSIAIDHLQSGLNNPDIADKTQMLLLFLQALSLRNLPGGDGPSDVEIAQAALTQYV